MKGSLQIMALLGTSTASLNMRILGTMLWNTASTFRVHKEWIFQNHDMTLISKSSAFNTQRATLTTNQHIKQAESVTSQKLKHSLTTKIPNIMNSALKGYLIKLSLFIMILIFFLTEIWSEMRNSEQIENNDKYMYNYLQKYKTQNFKDIWVIIYI